MAGALQLDVLIPTYNRCQLLRVTLDSLLNAVIPAGLAVTITVVDNNSRDDTRAVVESYEAKFASRLHYILERRQGRSHALNAGIAATTGGLIGMIDDDEQVDSRWFEVIQQWFAHDDIDYIGGPYKPNWEIQPPAWLPDDCSGVLGIIDNVQQVCTYGVDYSGMLMGGNAVLRRSIFEQVGVYSTQLGRTDKKLLSCEDEDLYARILASGAHGKYVPDLIIYHHIPASRMTKPYYRKWFFWRGVSKYIMNRQRPEPVPHLFHVPRYLYGRAVRDSGRALQKSLSGNLRASDRFSTELRWWDLAGWLYGRRVHASGE